MVPFQTVNVMFWNVNNAWKRLRFVLECKWLYFFIRPVSVIFTPPAVGEVLREPGRGGSTSSCKTKYLPAHGLYRCTEYRLLSEPMSTRLLNCISSRICRQNTQFNMYTTTSKQEEGCTFKDSHPKCFITTNFDKFHREAFARGGESRWCFDSMFPWYTKSKVNSNGVCNYYDFIRLEGLSLAIWFDIVESAFGENINMTAKIFANVHQLMFLYGFWY